MTDQERPGRRLTNRQRLVVDVMAGELTLGEHTFSAVDAGLCAPDAIGAAARAAEEKVAVMVALVKTAPDNPYPDDEVEARVTDRGLEVRCGGDRTLSVAPVVSNVLVVRTEGRR